MLKALFNKNSCVSLTKENFKYFSYSAKSSSKAKLLSKTLEENDDLKMISSHILEANRANYIKLKDRYENYHRRALAGGGESGIKRHVERNRKIRIRDRIKNVLDEDSPVLELGMFAGFDMEYGDVPCAGIVGVIGKIHGLWCLVSGNDATVKSGSVYPITLRKQLRCQDIGKENLLPTIYLVDSGGAFLPLQADIFNLGGRTFYNEAINGAMGVPQIALVCGSCTAGGAYVPAMADESVIVDRIGTIFLGGPPLVQAATGERVTPEELGGARLHCNISGCTDHFATNEQEGFEMIRDIVLTLNYLPDFDLKPPTDINRLKSNNDVDNDIAAGYVSKSNRHSVDMRMILRLLADECKFHEFKKTFGTTLICGFMFVSGHLTGIVNNNGRLTDKAAIKGSHFVQLCEERNLPIIFLQNQTFDDFEFDQANPAAHSIIKSRAKLMQAVATTTVPKVVLSVGGAVGSPHGHSLCSLAMGARFHFVWPNVKFTPMNLNNLDACLTNDFNADNESLTTMCKSTDVFYGSSRLWCDEIILPEHTKNKLTICLEVFRQQKLVQIHRSVTNVAKPHAVYRM